MKTNISTNNQKVYHYKCPDTLGYLEIFLDDKDKLLNCVFIDHINKKSFVLPEVIQKSLNNYFYKKQNLPQDLVSKEIVGTDFQKSIWKVISEVSFGETITYTDMAEKVNRPRAARAAGTACGKNPLALFIPCHRVVRKQNEDYGYSWGTNRKKYLLGFEK